MFISYSVRHFNGDLDQSFMHSIHVLKQDRPLPPGRPTNFFVELAWQILRNRTPPNFFIFDYYILGFKAKTLILNTFGLAFMHADQGA